MYINELVSNKTCCSWEIIQDAASYHPDLDYFSYNSELNSFVFYSLFIATSQIYSIKCARTHTCVMTPLFIAAIHAVSVSVAAPAQWDAVAIFTLELVGITL